MVSRRIYRSWGGRVGAAADEVGKSDKELRMIPRDAHWWLGRMDFFANQAWTIPA